VQTIRTIRRKISVADETRTMVDSLFERYAKTCTEIAQWGRDNRESNKIRLQHRFNRGSGALESAGFKGRFQFRPTSVALDARTFTLKLSKEVVSFSTHGRRVTAPLEIAEYQHEALWGAELAQSAILVKAKDGIWINIIVENAVPEAPSGDILGVDFGIRRIGTTSTGRRFNGSVLREFRDDRWRVRASLQSTGTKGARGVLRRLSGLDRRRATWENHRISKWIAEEAQKTGCSTIALEDLRGIRDRLKVRNKHLNRMVPLWSFAQLREFIRYKAAARGIRVLETNPAFTSLTCHRCHEVGMRTLDIFSCTTCGEFDADVNAAKNIAAGGAKAGDIPADRHVARIVDFFVGESLHRSQAKAPGL
jgi:IS605 OrfB family transposase